MRINNHKLGDIVYHDQFFEYFNQLRGALNIQPDDNAILRGLQLSQSGTNVNVSAGWATGKPVFISFIKNNFGDTIRPCEEAVATGIPLPDPFNGFVYLQFVMSSMVAGAAFYDVTTQIVIATAPTAAFPTGSIIGEVCLGSVSRNGALITISNVGRDFDAAPSGSPVLADSYDASTDSPPLSGMSTPSFYRVGTAGTQVINGKAYDLDVSDLVFRDASGYSVVRGDNGGLHIEKAINYTLLTTDLPENQIVGLHNTSGVSIDFTLPATYATDTQPDYVDVTKTIITVGPDQTIYVRNKQGNAIELLGSDLANAVSADYANSVETIAGVITNKSVTPKGLADTLDNAATKGTNTKYGTLKTASAASAQAGTATDEALTSSNIPDITASNVEAKAMAIDNKFLTPKNLDALRAVLADISDTLPLDDKFVTDKHLVDWFGSAGRVSAFGGSYGLIQKFPSGHKLYSVSINSPVLAANQLNLLATTNFPAGTFTTKPQVVTVGNYGDTAVGAGFLSWTATSVSMQFTNYSAVAKGAGVSVAVILFIGI